MKCKKIIIALLSFFMVFGLAFSNQNAQATGKVSSIFEFGPKYSSCPDCQWGLRGDPVVWAEAKKHFEKFALPMTPEAFTAEFKVFFEKFCKVSLDSSLERYRFADRTIGMSSGVVSLEHWRKSILPELIEKLKVANKL